MHLFIIRSTYDHRLWGFGVLGFWGLIDNVQSDLADDGYIKGIRTASKFNRDFIKNVKYKTTLLGGYRGMFDKRVNQVLEDEKQYPYESFYLHNKDAL